MRRYSGFTLIELAVVLVIISLLLSAILGGRSLVENARLKSIISDVELYQLSVVDFETKYLALPGDLSDADDFFTCGAGSAPLGCNGDADGIINMDGNVEMYRAWQHLALADMIPGQYTGVSGGVPADMVGENIPASKIEAVGFRLGAVTSAVNSRTGHALDLTTSGGDGALHPSHARSIDLKMDDGFADSGLVHSVDGTSVTLGDCLDNAATSRYNLVISEETCRMYFFLGLPGD